MFSNFLLFLRALFHCLGFTLCHLQKRTGAQSKTGLPTRLIAFFCFYVCSFLIHFFSISFFCFFLLCLFFCFLLLSLLLSFFLTFSLFFLFFFIVSCFFSASILCLWSFDPCTKFSLFCICVKSKFFVLVIDSTNVMLSKCPLIRQFFEILLIL